MGIWRRLAGHTAGNIFPKQDVFAKSRRAGSAPGPRQEGSEKGWGKQGDLGRSPSGVWGGNFVTEGDTPMPILHCGLVRVAKKSYEYRKCTRKSCPFANAPQKRYGGQPIRPGSGGGQTRGALAPAFKSRTIPCVPPVPALRLRSCHRRAS